jgi:hypothetical protein
MYMKGFPPTMTRRKQIRLTRTKPTLDTNEFYALTDLLYEALKGNVSEITRLLGISRNRWKAWETNPPKWPWWNFVLRHVILEVLAQLKGKGGISRSHRNRILEALGRITTSDHLILLAEQASDEYAGAERHLLGLLSRKGMYWDIIRLPANSGGYTEKTLRVAARKIGIVKRQKGYGDDKRSYWRLPREDDE